MASSSAWYVPQRYSIHKTCISLNGRAYNDFLVSAAGGGAPLPPWRAAMYSATGLSKRAHPEDYRDRWDDEESAAAAAAQLRELEAAVAAAAAARGAPADAAAAAAP